jgi:hypothetical protein
VGITQHLTRNHHPPPLWGAGLIALGICAISMAGFALGVDLAVLGSLFAAWTVIVINPLVIAVLSPSLVWQTTRDDHF